MKSKFFQELIRRYPQNPIITVNHLPYLANSVFNAGATKFGEEYLLLLRVEDRRGISHLTVARSKDGITGWEIDKKPTLYPQPDQYPEEIWGIEDSRITYLAEMKCWAITYTAFSQGGPLVSLATTTDFKTFEKHGPVMPPEDKDAGLFPERFKGRWDMIHRPVATYPTQAAHIWISFSPDLKHWGDHRILIPARRGSWWDSDKVGLAPPPLKTEKGWLILYHGVKFTASGGIYRLGLALLDLEEPQRVLARSTDWIFAPEENYELFGDVNKVVFPCGWIAEGDELKIYYGSADTSVCLAFARVSELLSWLEEHNSLK